MELSFRRLGAGKPIVILHGLYGSSDNWYSIGRALADRHEVFIPDQRNHGNSPHSPDHDYNLMSEDFNDFFIQHGLQRAVILGHSMGGKTALAFGLNHPEKVEKMIVVDISPFGYDESSAPEVISHEKIMQSLMILQPESLKDRQDADDRLRKHIRSAPVRQFLLKNLKRNSEGVFYWAMNLPVLQRHLPDIYASIMPSQQAKPGDIPVFPLLFIKGKNSGYLGKEEFENIRRYFPHAGIIEIEGAGHWVHAEQPDEFLKTIRNYIDE
jgi:pimeloyl-ACP methyl ester carboxylesterase